MTIIRWDAPPHNPNERVTDGPWGRYLVRRERKGARYFVATLNGRRTSYGGVSREDATRAIESVIIANYPDYRRAP